MRCRRRATTARRGGDVGIERPSRPDRGPAGGAPRVTQARYRRTTTPAASAAPRDDATGELSARSPAGSTSSPACCSSSAVSSSPPASTSMSPASSATASTGSSARSPVSPATSCRSCCRDGHRVHPQATVVQPVAAPFGWTFVGARGARHPARRPGSARASPVNGVTKAGGVRRLGRRRAVAHARRRLRRVRPVRRRRPRRVSMLITQASLRTLAQRTGHAAQKTGRGIGAVAAPLGRAARQALK